MSECLHGLTSATCASCKRGPVADDSYSGPPPEIDYAWESRKHDVKTGRTRKGRTTQRVTRFGPASVVGSIDHDVNGRPLLAEYGPDVHVIHPSTAAARLLAREVSRSHTGRDGVERPNVTRRRHGFDGLTIGRICAQAFGDTIPKVLTGTDVRQYEQVIHRDRAAQSTVTAHACGIDGDGIADMTPRLTLKRTGHPDGTYSVSCGLDTIRADIVDERGANRAQTSTKLAWQARGTSEPSCYGRLAYERRADDPVSRRVFRVASDGTCERVVVVVTGTDDTEHLWDGFQMVERVAPIRIDGERHALADRTTITADTVELPTTRDAWERLILKLEPGKRADLGHVTITYGNAGFYSAVVRGENPMRHRSRTASGLALKLAS